MQDPSKAKVLYTVGSVPMVGHVVHLCKEIGAEPVVCIIGFGREQVSAYLSSTFTNVRTAVQEEQLGTAHAVQQARRALEGFDGDVLILSGDVPLLTKATTEKLIGEHRAKQAIATVLAVKLDNPTGYGRIIRSAGGSLEKIVEERDATDEERKVQEINTGIYIFDSGVLFSVLDRIGKKNAQGEYYLTDAFELLIAQFGVGSIAVVTTQDPIEASGVNTKDQLAALEAEYLRRAH